MSTMKNKQRRISACSASLLRFESLEPRHMLAGEGLTGEYFDAIDLTQLAGTRTDAVVNFPNDALGNNAQGLVVSDDNYSIRWSGWVNVAQSGQWQFTTFSNDGVRLWVDNTQLIDHWDQHGSARDDGQIQLNAGWHSIRMEYFQQDGTTDSRLLFSGPGQNETIIPQASLSTVDPNIGDPIANAGPDRVVVLPADSLVLDGSATDDGTITTFAWTQLSGPGNATLANANTEDLTASSLVQGVYEFQLTVTDNELNTDTDTVLVNVVPTGGLGIVSGELKEWHKVTVDFLGPITSETAAINPFTDYRLDVTFTHQGNGQSFVVPGYYAADGDAANSSAAAGNVWRVHFAPDEAGTWAYSASFRTGSNVAVSDLPNPGAGAGFFDGATGSFAVAATDKSGRDFRGQGRLEYVGEHYLRFAGSGKYFLKQGADSPENLLAYADFDGPFASDGQNDNLVKDFAPHVADWNPGDPTWGAGQKGKGLIGAINYLSSEGVNAFSFLPMNINGDDRNVFPYLDYNERFRMDVSRLGQWEVAFEHADQLGMFLHFKTQETENELLLDGGSLGAQRKLYYRELIARFSHHLALNWNLGEEINNATTAQKQSWAKYFADNDPYNHHIVIHNGSNHYDLLGPANGTSGSELTGFSLQTNSSAFINVHDSVKNYITRSADAGKPWAVSVDEPGDAQHAIRPDNDAGNSHIDGRKNALWGGLLAGAWGLEYYFGYGHADSDLTLNDFRSRDAWWDFPRHALEFFNDNDVPFWQMTNDNDISSATDDYGFVKTNDTYVVYLKNGGTTNLDLTGTTGNFDVQWFDPRNGGVLQNGTITSVASGGLVSLGSAPNSLNEDWTILVRRQASTGPNEPPQVAINKITPLVSAEGAAFQEQNGLVVFELESQPATDSWQLQTSVPGFTGAGYYRWEGPNLFSNPGAQGVIEYKINITNPGLYQMRFHNHRNSGIPSDQENDIWTKMDNGSWIKVYSGLQGQWSWHSRFDLGSGNHADPSYQLAAGEHTFTISGRSNGFRVDRVVLYNTNLTSTLSAQNLSNPQSPILNGTNDLTFQLEGSVLDDGQILLSPQLQWSLESGPGLATFATPQSATTEVEFSIPGTYVVKFTANDGEFTSSSTRTIIAPVVDPPQGGAADFHTDGVINGSDFLAWQRGFGLPNAQYHEGDANEDGQTDGDDLAIWENTYGTTVSPLAAHSTAIAAHSTTGLQQSVLPLPLDDLSERTTDKQAEAAILIDVAIALVLPEADAVDDEESFLWIDQPLLITTLAAAYDQFGNGTRIEFPVTTSLAKTPKNQEQSDPVAEGGVLADFDEILSF